MKYKILVVAFLLCIAIFNSGCIDGELNADEIAEKMQEKQANIEDISATVHITTSMNDKVQEMEYQMIQKNPNKMRSVVVMPEEMAGQTTVSDGVTMWMYEPAANKVTIIEMPETPDASEMDYSNFIGSILNESHVLMEGTDELDGRDTYILTLEPKENESLDVSLPDMKVWVDKETWTPLKIEMGIEDEYQSVIEYRNFEVNTGISDEEFEFIIPEGAEVVDVGDFENLLPVEITLEEAQNISDFEILVPSYVPEGYELDNVMLSNNTLASNVKESITLIYSSDEYKIILSENFYEGEQDQNSLMIESETVSVNGAEGNLYSMYDDSSMLQWETDNAIISISGPLDKTEVIKIAESME